MLEKFAQPEYVHVLLNPLPIYGLAAGVLGLVVALVLRQRAARVTALIVIAVTALTAWPVFEFGEQGYDRVKSMSDAAGEQWLDEHMWRAEKAIAFFFVVAAVALAALIAPRKWPRSDMPLTVATLALALAALAIGGWISFAGGQVRHREFRDGPPPERQHADHHPGAGEEKPPEQQQSAPEQTSAPPAEPTQAQVEASRMQLDASRAQLEASRKLVEATPDASQPQQQPAPAQPPGAAQPPAKPAASGATPQPKAADGHAHKH